MKKTDLAELFENLGLTGEVSGYYGYAVNDLPPVLKVLNDWLFNELDEFIRLYLDKGHEFSIWIGAFPLISHRYFNDQWSYLGFSQHPKPEVQLYGVSAYGAENLVRDWMKHLGYKDAKTTQFRRDEGVDVTTEEFDIQVKNFHSDYVPVSAIREIYGVALSRGKKPIFFSHSDYSFDSVQFAERVSMPLLRFKPEAGELVACNIYAERFLARQKNHLNDMRSLESDWNEFVDVERTARQFLETLANSLRQSRIEKYEEAADNYRISAEFKVPTFMHDQNNCGLPERCSDLTSQQFKSLTFLREASGPILETLINDVERGFFRP